MLQGHGLKSEVWEITLYQHTKSVGHLTQYKIGHRALFAVPGDLLSGPRQPRCLAALVREFAFQRIDALPNVKLESALLV